MLQAKWVISLCVVIMILLFIPACGPSATSQLPLDSDGDGWSDAQETLAGTDPHKKDTDDDGYWDPNDPNPLDASIPGTDSQTTTPSGTSATQPTVGPYNNILFITSASASSYDTFIDTLQAEGFTVDLLTTDREISEDILSEYGVLYLQRMRYSDDETVLLVNWIKAGGGALFEAVSYHADEANAILLPLCGIIALNDKVKDPANPGPGGSGYVTSNISRHPITTNMSSYVYFSGTSSLEIIEQRAEVVIAGEEDAYCNTYIHSPPLVAVDEPESGRIVVVVHSSVCFHDSVLKNPDNLLFALNVMNWLAHKS